jgi:hypothetical protein
MSRERPCPLRLSGGPACTCVELRCGSFDAPRRSDIACCHVDATLTPIRTMAIVLITDGARGIPNHFFRHWKRGAPAPLAIPNDLHLEQVLRQDRLPRIVRIRIRMRLRCGFAFALHLHFSVANAMQIPSYYSQNSLCKYPHNTIRIRNLQIRGSTSSYETRTPAPVGVPTRIPPKSEMLIGPHADRFSRDQRVSA